MPVLISRGCRNEFSSEVDQFWCGWIEDFLKSFHARQKWTTARRNFWS